MKHWSSVLKNLTMLSQLGLSLVSPLLLCLALCWWLTTRFGIGGWVYILGFFFGLGGSATVAYKVYRSVMNREKKEQDEKKHRVAFNRHS